ncbi:GntR family transcriptional regulator [Paracoccus sp. PXZ]|uniref:GntR family transcriptional regulator n=1 Tax=Paracoccus denitrificans TaxID=266 RepID=UPI001E45C8F0|nr:GntR family transcriptional regulator [Paracoccus denitrificans]UFS67214.1 GntR family transcriptional regulator [Paracoccus denitrificans]
MRNLDTGRGLFAAIDQQSPVPLYLQIVAQMEAALREGRLLPGATIPPEPALCEMFSVSRKTLRRATDHLVSLGLIRRIHGVGTVVTEDAQVEGLSGMQSIYDRLVSTRKTPETRLLLQETTVIDAEASALTGFSVGEEVVRLRRLRFSNKVPLAVLENVATAAILPLTGRDTSESFLAALNRRGFRAHVIHRQVEAVLADNRTAQDLDIPEGTPILRETQRSQDRHGRVFNLAVNYYHPTNFLMATVEFAEEDAST